MAAETLASDRIKRHLDDLETQHSLLANCILLWKSLSDRLNALHQTVAGRSQALQADLQSIDSSTQQAIDSISQRESSLSDRESAAAAAIRERRDAVLAEIEQPDSRSPPAAESDLRGLLRWYARRMDSAGLWRFVASRRRALSLLRREITDAVDDSIDPARLVIDAVENFLVHPIEDGADRNWALGMLLRSLLGSEGTKAPIVAESIRERAVVVAELWKKKFGQKSAEGEREETMGGSEAQIFLQIVAAFGLRSRFEEDFLMTLLMEHASRKEMAKLASAIGFREQLAVIIDKLRNTNKEIEAIHFVHYSGLSDRFPPESLLKEYLQASRRKSNSIKDENNSPAALQESINVEMTALRSIIKCVESCNLESRFNTNELKRRLARLEKAKADRKKPAVPKKFRSKRPAPIGGTGAAPTFPAKAARTSNAPFASFNQNSAAVSHIPPAHNAYGFPGQGRPDGPASAPYANTGRSQSPSTATQWYYMDDDIVGRVPYGGGSAISYGGHDYPSVTLGQPSYPH